MRVKLCLFQNKEDYVKFENFSKIDFSFREKCSLREGENVLTSCYPEDTHDPDDGGVDRDDLTLHLLQYNAHHWQDDNEHVQLVPPEVHKMCQQMNHKKHVQEESVKSEFRKTE